jgi:hypothetical protein
VAGESLRDLLTRLNMHLLRYPATTLSQPGRWEESIAEHAAIIDAIEQRQGTELLNSQLPTSPPHEISGSRSGRAGWTDRGS